MDPLGLALAVAVSIPLSIGMWRGLDWLVSVRERRRTRIERELERKEREMRAAIFSLAQQLNGDALEARRTLIRESFLASQQRGKKP